MPLDLYGPDREMADYIATQPAAGPPGDPAGIGEAFTGSFMAAQGTFRVLRAAYNSQTLVRDWLDAFEAKTGYRPEPFGTAVPGSFNYDLLNKAYQTEKTSNPNFDLTPPPTTEQAWQHAMDIERQFAVENARIQGRPQTPWSWLGTQAGALAAFAADPITLAVTAASGFTGPAAEGILAIALRDALVVGGSQFGISVTNQPISQAINPDYGTGDILSEAGLAGLTGAGLGLFGRLGVAGTAAIWSRLKTGNWSRTVRDAGNVVERQAVNATGDPNAGRAAGPEGAASFARNGNQAEAAVTAGKPVEPTPDLFTNGTYRPGRVFTAGTGPDLASLPQQILMKAREAGSYGTFRVSDPEAAMLERAGYKRNEDGSFDTQPLWLEADRRVKAGTWDKTMSIYDNSHLTAPPAPSRVFTATGPVDVQYQVVPADSLVTSNRPDLSVNPAYPAELQPRDRTRAASAEQLNAISTRLEPERLGPSADAATGAPIAGPDNVVESGNVRVLAIIQAYARDAEQAQAYRAFLVKQGFDITGIKDPVLVARRITTLNGDERVSFTNAANQAVAMRMSAPEQAAADARLLDENVLGKLVEAQPVDSADNRAFVRSFFAQLPKEERGALVDRAGTMSVEGQRRVQAALLARAYGDAPLLSRLLESPEAGMKGIGGALGDVAGSWAALRAAVSRGAVPAQMDLTPDLLAAFRLVERARARGVKPGDLLAQGDAFAAPVSPATRALLGLMFRDEALTKAASRPAVARGLRAYAEEAVKNTTDARLFGEPLGQGDVLTAALQKAGREDLAAGAEASLAPDLLAEKVADPVTGDASVHAVDHLLETTPNATIDWPHATLKDAEGNPVMVQRPVRELLAEADAEIAAAKEIEACASGEMLAAAE